MAQRTVTIGSAVGLHARPASLFVRAATATGLHVTIARDGEDTAHPVEADSILAVMGLGARHGERVVLQADGDGADDALDRLADLLSQDLDHAE
jgi:phosphocarrier protein HPr